MGFMSKKQDKKVVEPVYTPPARSVVTRREPAPVPTSGPGSYIGKSLDIKADITSNEDITIEGRVTGNISVSKTVTIGLHGAVTADIKAAVVRIIGKAKGNIIATDKVEILSQGRFSGNIESKKLVVAEGAVLNGNINEEKKKNS